VGLCILTGLRDMHAGGYCHLDVKPDNLGVQQEGDLGSVALMDYGSAQPIGADSIQSNSCADHIFSIAAYNDLTLFCLKVFTLRWQGAAPVTVISTVCGIVPDDLFAAASLRLDADLLNRTAS